MNFSFASKSGGRLQLQGHLHYGVKLFVFVYDVGPDFIEVGREEVRNGGHELLNESLLAKLKLQSSSWPRI